MLKKIGIVIGMGFLLCCCIFGIEKTLSYLYGATVVINHRVDDESPMEVERARIDGLIKAEQKNVLRYGDEIGDIESHRDATDKSIAADNEKLVAETNLLKQIKTLLDEKRDQYTIGRNTYTYAEVNADALERIKAVKLVQENIGLNKGLLADLDEASQKCRNALGDARKRLQELKNAMTSLDARDAIANVRLKVNELTNAFNRAPLSVDSELVKAVRNYDRRVRQKERLVNNENHRIDYTPAIVTENAATEIDKMIGGKTSRETDVLQTPTQRPSATDALKDTQS